MSRDSRRPVVFVIGSAHRGGAESQLVRLASELVARGLVVRVLFLVDSGPLTAILDAGGVRWTVCRRVKSPFDIVDFGVMLLVAAWQLAWWRPRVTFAWLGGSMWMALPLVRWFTRSKRVASLRGDTLEPGFRGRIQRWVVSRAHAVTVNAPHLEAEAVRCGADASKIVFIPNGVDPAPVRATVVRTPPTAVMIANFKWYKGHDLLLSAMRGMRNPLMLRFVGMGDSSDVDKLAADYGLSDRVAIVAQPADVQTELAAAQFAVHTARTEGMPNAVLEALSFGLPVVATDVGAIALLVADVGAGFVVPLGDEETLTRRLDQVAGDAALRSELGQAAFTASLDYRWDVCAQRYLDLITTLTAESR